MTRLRSFAAPARQARLRSFAAPARQACLVAAAMTIGGSPSLLACPQCFGAEATSMIDGAKPGVPVLLALTFVLQGGFVGFFLSPQARQAHRGRRARR